MAVENKIVDIKYEIVKIKFITRMLSYGANKDNTEIRIPEFKSSMRYWWRALGDFNQNNDVKEKNIYLNNMRESERSIFGDTNIASPFFIKLNEEKIRDDYKEIGEKVRDETPSMYFLLKYIKKSKGREGWNLNKYIDLLSIVSVLGGIGAKSRRGYGSFIIEGCNIYKDISLENFKKRINKLFHNDIYEIAASNYVEGKEAIIRQKTKIPSCEYPYVEEIFIGKEMSIVNFKKYQ